MRSVTLVLTMAFVASAAGTAAAQTDLYRRRSAIRPRTRRA
jgi:hypothetical protein